MRAFKNRKGSRSNRHTGGARLETLEDRRLFSGTTLAVIEPIVLPWRTLTVNGTAASETIVVTQSGINITVTRNGVTTQTDTTFLLGDIVVNGLDGNDVIRMVNVGIRSTINGGNGNDTITAGSGNDTISGGANNDIIDGGLGADTINGGTGTDRADYSSRTAAVNVFLNDVADDGQSGEQDNVRSDVENVDGGSGNDFIESPTSLNVLNYFRGNGGNDVLDGGSGNDILEGGAGNDTLWGYIGNDELYGGDGDDGMAGEDGDDLLDGGLGADNIMGGSGVDSALYSSRTVAVEVTVDDIANDGSFGPRPDDGFDHISWRISTEFDNVHADIETVVGGSADDYLSSPFWQNRADNLYGMGGNDVISGGGGADVLVGGTGNDSIYGEDGNDVLYGGVGNDTLNGGYGNDSLYGEAGVDGLYGDSHNDTLDGGTGADILSGGSGIDVADYSSRTAGINVSLDGFTNDGASGENDNVTGDVENVRGGSGNDTITSPASSTAVNTFWGNGGSDTLDGGGGNDTLNGGAANDILRGNHGNDAVNGDAGNDTLSGGNGNDTLHGNDNNDTLNGDGGDDSLFGDAGNDDLYGDGGTDMLSGGSGNDGLFGGFGIDSLTGGTGNDRFLDHCWVTGSLFGHEFFGWEDNLTDRLDSEARIGIRNGGQVTKSFAGQDGDYTFASGTWLDSEVKLIDSALRVLHDLTGDAVLLRRANGDDMKFRRHGALTESDGGSFVAGAWNEGDQIAFPDAAFGFDDGVRETLFHEMGHNWDEEFNESGWQSLSGWTDSDRSGNPSFQRGGDSSGDWWHLTTAQFASTYAMTNPNEDFAESFARFCMTRGGFLSGLRIVAAKSTFMQTMVNSL